MSTLKIVCLMLLAITAVHPLPVIQGKVFHNVNLEQPPKIVLDNFQDELTHFYEKPMRISEQYSSGNDHLKASNSVRKREGPVQVGIPENARILSRHRRASVVFSFPKKNTNNKAIPKKTTPAPKTYKPPIGPKQCGGVCWCFPELHVINCDKRNLTQFPTFEDDDRSGTKWLLMRDNDIKNLDHTKIDLSDWPSLSFVDLRGNKNLSCNSLSDVANQKWKDINMACGKHSVIKVYRTEPKPEKGNDQQSTQSEEMQESTAGLLTTNSADGHTTSVTQLPEKSTVSYTEPSLTDPTSGISNVSPSSNSYITRDGSTRTGIPTTLDIFDSHQTAAEVKDKSGITPGSPENARRQTKEPSFFEMLEEIFQAPVVTTTELKVSSATESIASSIIGPSNIRMPESTLNQYTDHTELSVSSKPESGSSIAGHTGLSATQADPFIPVSESSTTEPKLYEDEPAASVSQSEFFMTKSESFISETESSILESESSITESISWSTDQFSIVEKTILYEISLTESVSSVDKSATSITELESSVTEFESSGTGSESSVPESEAAITESESSATKPTSEYSDTGSEASNTDYVKSSVTESKLFTHERESSETKIKSSANESQSPITGSVNESFLQPLYTTNIASVFEPTGAFSAKITTTDETEPPLNFTVMDDSQIELDDFSMPDINDLIDDDTPQEIIDALSTIAPMLENYIAPQRARQTGLDGTKTDTKTVVTVCSVVFILILVALIGVLVRRGCKRGRPYRDIV